MHTVDIDIFVNQMGNLKIRWVFSLKLIKEDNKIEMPLPSFKYDLPRLAGVPVPFSSKAFPLSIENIHINKQNHDMNFKLVQDFYGDNKLIIENKGNKPLEDNDSIVLEYEVKEIVNNDSIYFVFVYPLINPFDEEINFKVDVKAGFSFHIRKICFQRVVF